MPSERADDAELPLLASEVQVSRGAGWLVDVARWRDLPGCWLEAGGSQAARGEQPAARQTTRRPGKAADCLGTCTYR